MKNIIPRINNLPDAVITTVENGGLLKAIVERLAFKNSCREYSPITVPGCLLSIDTSTVETYVNGKSIISGKPGCNSASFDTCFLFTCIRGDDSLYFLTWARSLS